MGTTGSSPENSSLINKLDVSFNDFNVLRAIGRGSFGKVCIVQLKSSGKLYAMKYMSKEKCIKRDAIKNVLKEIDILSQLDHPLLVNLWFTFQDNEDMCMVVDLLLGGDLRYHIQQSVRFSSFQLKLYVAEVSLALDYLSSNFIVHRDIKPDNILLDDKGHIHVTDFNVASYLVREQNGRAVSVSGTKPYMAPEVFASATHKMDGYCYSVDWWSLGITIYELIRGRRPYEIHSMQSNEEILEMLMKQSLTFSTSWDADLVAVMKGLLEVNHQKRVTSVEKLKTYSAMSEFDFDEVLTLKVSPEFVPSQDNLNCDPTFELEEMIIESKPLHKKKKRLAKMIDAGNSNDPMLKALEKCKNDFIIYNRLQK